MIMPRFRGNYNPAVKSLNKGVAVEQHLQRRKATFHLHWSGTARAVFLLTFRLSCGI